MVPPAGCPPPHANTSLPPYFLWAASRLWFTTVWAVALTTSSAWARSPATAASMGHPKTHTSIPTPLPMAA